MPSGNHSSQFHYAFLIKVKGIQKMFYLWNFFFWEQNPKCPKYMFRFCFQWFIWSFHLYNSKIIEKTNNKLSLLLFMSLIVVFFMFSMQKMWKSIFWPVFGVRSTQKLVKFYNKLSFPTQTQDVSHGTTYYATKCGSFKYKSQICPRLFFDNLIFEVL